MTYTSCLHYKNLYTSDICSSHTRALRASPFDHDHLNVTDWFTSLTVVSPHLTYATVNSPYHYTCHPFFFVSSAFDHSFWHWLRLLLVQIDINYPRTHQLENQQVFHRFSDLVLICALVSYTFRTRIECVCGAGKMDLKVCYCFFFRFVVFIAISCYSGVRAWDLFALLGSWRWGMSIFYKCTLVSKVFCLVSLES